MRLRLQPGWRADIGDQGQFLAGQVIDVHNLTEAQHWLDEGWGIPAPDAPVNAVSKLLTEPLRITATP